MDIQVIFEFLRDATTVQAALAAFFASHAATAGLEELRAALKSKLGHKPLEYQMIDSLDKALEKTCGALGWEYDGTAIPQTFLRAIAEWQDVFTRASLGEILGRATARSVSDEETEIFFICFIEQISSDDHQQLHRFVTGLHSAGPHSKEATGGKNDSRILTPGAMIWENPDFVGREALLEELGEAVARGGEHIQLTGMGGIGKTELLLHLYARHAQHPDSSPADFVAYLSYNGSLADTLVQDLDPGRLPERGWEAALAYLRRLGETSRLLLLIDDISPRESGKMDAIRLDPHFGELFTLRATVILASRAPHQRFRALEVKALAEPERRMLFEKSRRAPTPEAHRPLLKGILEERAGSNTQVVQRLGVMARKHGLDLPGLEAMLERERFAIRRGMGEETLQQEINKLYRLDGGELGAGSVSLLEAFSVLPYLPLGLRDCVAWMGEDAGLTETDCRLALLALAEQSWLELRGDEEEGALQMHPVVAAAVGAQSAPVFQAHRHLVTSCTASIVMRNEDTVQDTKPYIPFAVALAEKLPTLEEESGDLLSWIGRYHHEMGAYEQALEWYGKALAIREKVLGTEHLSTATTYNNMAGVYEAQGEYQKALKWHEKALVIREKVLGTENFFTAITYNNMAGIYQAQGDYDLALEWFGKALAIREKILGTEHPRTATTYNNIAGVYKDQGDYDLALEWFGKALAIREKILGTEHPRTATTYNNIAGVYEAQGDYEQALEWFGKALTIREKVLGTEHPDTATTYSNMAGIYQAQGNYEKALMWYGKALVIVEKILGTEHPSTAATYNNMAGVYRTQGDYEKALLWYGKALVIREKVLGTEHPSTAITYNNIAVIYEAQGNYDKALVWYGKALRFMCTRYPDHPNTWTLLNNAEICHDESGRDESFVQWLEDTLAEAVGPV